MIRLDGSLTSYVERFLLSRDVCPAYAKLIQARVGRLSKWAGHVVDVADVDADLANEWLAALAAEGLRPETVDGYRRALLVVWNDACLAGVNDHPPLRLRTIRKPRLIVRAFTHEEIRRLLVAASKLVRTYSNGTFERDFWQAAVHAAYSTGLRRGDLINRLRWADVAEDGTAWVIQHKTNYPVPVRLSSEALEFARRLGGPYVLPFPHHMSRFAVEFGRIAKAAGVGGQFKWLRRSAGSYADREQPGNGARLLGQRSDKVFKAHYDDHTITGSRPVEPPQIR